ncbi:MAG: site-2 protease family protein [Anaerolineales bacterium]|uniref:site-2 protease family protein n=1 Tax=Promineifilum sp. TaxID=2664178 RepID=UPI001D587217|nr:site-2 protease family protein [Anaerolineales bacterium]MCB8936256.1 site-2 protease family protein [Promineifilum sp.]MCO5182213.1 site-2 protease family protein [Promineifilum sp.]
MFDLDIYTIIARIIVLLVAFTIHELAHAVTADYLGDPTPRRMGRITLNPLKHLDPFGTIMLIIAGFGWAKPVMVNPMNMRGNPRTSMAIVAIAGPLSNLVMAAIAAVFFRAGLVDTNSLFLGNASSLSLANLLIQFLYINLALAFFNLIPVPPLDGSKILFAILPPELGYRLRPLEQYGFMILFLVVFLVPQVLNFLVWRPVEATAQLLLG